MRQRYAQANDVRTSIDALRRIVQRIRASAGAAERNVGITGAQLFVLRQLGDAPRMSVGQLAARTFTHQSSVSLVVQRLVDRRLVAKAPARHDRRRVELSVTASGSAMLRRARRPVQERLVEAIVRLPARDRRALARSLTAVAIEIGADGRTPMLFEEVSHQRRRRASTRRYEDGNAL